MHPSQLAVDCDRLLAVLVIILRTRLPLLGLACDWIVSDRICSRFNGRACRLPELNMESESAPVRLLIRILYQRHKEIEDKVSESTD